MYECSVANIFEFCFYIECRLWGCGYFALMPVTLSALTCVIYTFCFHSFVCFVYQIGIMCIEQCICVFFFSSTFISFKYTSIFRQRLLSVQFYMYLSYFFSYFSLFLFGIKTATVYTIGPLHAISKNSDVLDSAKARSGESSMCFLAIGQDMCSGQNFSVGKGIHTYTFRHIFRVK